MHFVTFCYLFREQEPNLDDYDAYTVAGVLKQYLRELPDHVLTKERLSDFEDAASRHGRSEKIKVKFANKWRRFRFKLRFTPTATLSTGEWLPT